MNYDEEGNLILKGKLGSAVAWGDLWEFKEAAERGSDPDLTYQDMADFTAFTTQFKILGNFLASEFDEYGYGQEMVSVIHRHDGATFGKFYWKGGGKYGEANLESDDFEGAPHPDGIWKFVPVEPFTIIGYKGVE